MRNAELIELLKTFDRSSSVIVEVETTTDIDQYEAFDVSYTAGHIVIEVNDD